MEQKRLARAFVLVAVLLIVWQVFFPPVVTPPATPGADSTAAATAGAPPPAAAPAAVTGAPAAVSAAPTGPPARAVTVRSPIYEYTFSTRGGALTSAELLRFPSYVQRGEHVQLVPKGAGDVLTGTAVAAGRTLDLRTAEFTPSAERVVVDAAGGPKTLTFTATQNGVPVAEVAYTFRPDDYLVDVRGRILGLGGSGTLYTSLGTGSRRTTPRSTTPRASSASSPGTVAGWSASTSPRSTRSGRTPSWGRSPGPGCATATS